jgi:hypothetical protein
MAALGLMFVLCSFYRRLWNKATKFSRGVRFAPTRRTEGFARSNDADHERQHDIPPIGLSLALKVRLVRVSRLHTAQGRLAVRAVATDIANRADNA